MATQDWLVKKRKKKKGGTLDKCGEELKRTVKPEDERLPLWESGCLRFSVLQTETLACSLGRPGGKTQTYRGWFFCLFPFLKWLTPELSALCVCGLQSNLCHWVTGSDWFTCLWLYDSFSFFRCVVIFTLKWISLLSCGGKQGSDKKHNPRNFIVFMNRRLPDNNLHFILCQVRFHSAGGL